jgi:hypothetical protein
LKILRRIPNREKIQIFHNKSFETKDFILHVLFTGKETQHNMLKHARSVILLPNGTFDLVQFFSSLTKNTTQHVETLAIGHLILPNGTFYSV